MRFGSLVPGMRGAWLMVMLSACSRTDGDVAPDASAMTTDAAMDGSADATTPDAHAWDPTPPNVFNDPTGMHPDVMLHAPSDYPTTADRPRPLVVFLHGYSVPTYPGWAPIEAGDVLFLAPLGALDASGSRYWNASSACCDRYHTGNDDVGYVGGLIDRAIAFGWHVDLSRVWVVGVSNGGFLAERLACDRSDIVTAIVDFAGAGRATTDPTCTPSHQVAALVDHSEADQTIKWGGGSLLNLPPYPIVLGAGGTTDRGDCSTLQLTATGLDHDINVAGPDTDVYEAACDRGPLTFWRETSAAHAFPATTAWGDDVLTWLTSHPR